jgi:hypothetical protein
MLYGLSNINGKILYICKNNINKCVLETASDSNEKEERIGTKPWITQEIIKKMDERRKRDECEQRSKKDELQKTEEQITKSHWQDQEGVP